MFESFSRRSKIIVGAAGAEARQRGAPAVGVDSLVIALIIEDQDPDVRSLFAQAAAAETPYLSEPAHNKFFAPEVATELLAQLNASLPRSATRPYTAQVPTATETGRALHAAKRLQEDFHHGTVGPLHLLAAALSEPCEASRLLNEAGITEGKVLNALRNMAQTGES